MRMKKRSFFLTAAAVCAAFVLSSCSGPGIKIRFGAAGIGGNYYTCGQTLAEILSARDKGLEIEVRETAGSAANLRLLSGEYIQMAIAQSDIIHDAWMAEDLFEGKDPQRGYSAVAGLYTEACQIVVAADSGIENVHDLLGKRISIGEKESGTAQNAEEILLSCGINDKMAEIVNMNYSEAADALKNGGIDALFCTAGTRTAVVEDLAQQFPVRLLSLDEVEREKLLYAYDYFLPYEIPAGTYTGQDGPVETIGVRSILLAGDTMAADKVQEIAAALFAHADELQAALPLDLEISPEEASDSIPIPFHQGAAEYYTSQGISVTEG